MQQLTVPQGEFQLARYPLRKNETLRAWDAADEYLLQHLEEENLLSSHSRVLIVNDGFGALSTALAGHRPQMASDSHLSHRGTLANLQNSGLPTDSVRLLTSLQNPEGMLDAVLIKIPKSLALLEDQLFRIRPHLQPQTRLIGAAMAKGIHTSTLNLFERIIGPTRTSLARKKARLIFCQPDPDISPGETPYPKEYILENTGYRICCHANVFSRESLDIGTRLFLEHLPADPRYRTIVDLGCGNGVVGLMASEHNPQAELIFTDESFMAVASAQISFHDAFGSSRAARFLVGDCLEAVPENSVDLVLNNPPFHQQSAVGDVVSWQMFSESRKVLRKGGELWVVGNRHLGYHAKLKRLYGNCKLIASNRKFVILKAVR